MALQDRSEQHVYIQQQPIAPEKIEKRATQKQFKNRVTKIEKILMIGMVTVITGIAVMNLNVQSSINSASVEMQKTENNIDEIKKQNSELSMEVSELSTYDRIWKKAKAMGLKLNEKNVKVVSGQ